jgi:nitrate/TMAO reductase-like tetraheme cytochrome c subunit
MIKQNGVKIAAAVIGVGFLLGLFLFEPVTRGVVASDDLCSYCHVDREYRSEVRLSYSRPHPSLAEADAGAEKVSEPDKQVACVECHLPEGFINTFFAYAHFASLTDLFGHSRDRMLERSGAWIPARQVAAHRVRDRLLEYDSETCRSCHVEEEIEPKRERGKNAHKKALDEKKTCIECHYNEKHQSVDLRENAFAQTVSN